MPFLGILKIEYIAPSKAISPKIIANPIISDLTKKRVSKSKEKIIVKNVLFLKILIDPELTSKGFILLLVILICLL